MLYFLIVLAIIIIIYLIIKNYKSKKGLENLKSIQQEIKLCDTDIDCIKKVFYKYDEVDTFNEISKKCKLCNN